MAGHNPVGWWTLDKIELRPSPEPGQVAAPEKAHPDRPKPASWPTQRTSPEIQHPSLPQDSSPIMDKERDITKQARLRGLLLERAAKLKSSPGPAPSKPGPENIVPPMGPSKAAQDSGPVSDAATCSQPSRLVPVHGTVSSSLLPDHRHRIISVADPNYGRLSPPKSDAAQDAHTGGQSLANAPENGAGPSQNHGVVQSGHALPLIPKPTQTHYLPPVARTLMGVIGPGVQGGGSFGNPAPRSSIQPSTATEPIHFNREAAVKVEDSISAAFRESLDQKERPEKSELHSSPQILSHECQIRRFNPKFIQWADAQGFWCNLHLPDGQIVSLDRPSPNQALAKIICAKKAIPIVRGLPMWYIDKVPRSSPASSPRHKTVAARDIPIMSNALVVRNGINGTQMDVAAMGPRGHYGHAAWPVRLDPRENKIRKMEETMGFLIPPVYRDSELAAQAFLAGFNVARQGVESGPSPARLGRRSRVHRKRSPIRATRGGPEAVRSQTRAGGRSDRRARSRSPSLETSSSDGGAPTPSRRGRGDYYWPANSRRPADNYPAASGGVDHYHS